METSSNTRIPGFWYDLWCVQYFYQRLKSAHCVIKPAEGLNLRRRVAVLRDRLSFTKFKCLKLLVNPNTSDRIWVRVKAGIWTQKRRKYLQSTSKLYTWHSPRAVSLPQTQGSYGVLATKTSQTTQSGNCTAQTDFSFQFTPTGIYGALTRCQVQCRAQR